MGPAARLRALQADPNAAGAILARVAEGATLLDLVAQWKLPRRAFLSWVAANGELTEQCKRLRELVGTELRMEGLDLVDEATPETAAVVKLRADYREKLSRDLNKDLFGKYAKVEHRHSFDLGERLRRARDRVLDVQPTVELTREEPRAVVAEAAEHGAEELPPI